jgi:PAS domain S-box-containing protein
MTATASPGESAATIFVVDDDRGLARLIEKALQRDGFQTASAGSFDQAVSWLSDHCPDLMLLDLKLGDIGGKELIDHLTAHGRSVPFLIITGQGDERVAVAMMKRGAIDYLVKDASFLEFVPEVVRRALGQLERDTKLALAEEALRRSEANLAKAQRIAHAGSFELNVPPSSQDFRSEEIYRILGLTSGQDQLSSDDYVRRCVHPDDRAMYRATLTRAIAEASAFRFEYRVVRPDGTVRHVQSVGEPILDRAGKVLQLVGALLDITERKRAELRQRMQYATTEALAETVNLTEAAPRVLSAICQTLDWDFGELWEVDTASKALHPVRTWHTPGLNASGLQRSAQELVFSLGMSGTGSAWSSGKPLWSADMSLDKTLAGVNGSVEGMRCAVAFPVLLGVEVLGVVVLFSRHQRPADPDLLQLFSVIGSQLGQFLERKRTEGALRREHAFSSAVLDTSAALVVVLDRHGRIVRFNPACEQTTGYAAGEVRNKPPWDLFLIPEEREDVRAVFGRLCSGQFPSRYENHWLTRDGGKRLIEWSNSALVDDHGNVEYVISVGIDVTDRRRLEREILQISELEQRRIGHDLHDGLCQHLAATELRAEILAQKLQRKSTTDAAQVAEIGKQVREAISQTRLLARGLSPVVVESEGLMSALEELASYTERMFRVKSEFLCPGTVLIHDHAAATHLYRIAQEAVSNAIRHGKAKRIVISLRRVGDRNELRVKDNGKGLPKDVTKATGMGLRIMRYRAAIINGSLLVQADPDGGMSVTCSIQNRPNLNDGALE